MGPIFHVGYPKTATRWFQESLFPFIKGIQIIDKEDIFEYIIKPDSLSFVPLNALRHFNLSEKDTALFSSHEFIGTNYHFGFNGYMIKENALRIHQLYPDARIVLFIRNQADIIASSYAQYVKNNGAMTFKRY